MENKNTIFNDLEKPVKGLAILKHLCYSNEQSTLYLCLAKEVLPTTRKALVNFHRVTPFVLASLKLLLGSNCVFVNANTCYIPKKTAAGREQSSKLPAAKERPMIVISTQVLADECGHAQSIRLTTRQYHNTLRAHCPQVPQNGDAPDELPPLSPLCSPLLAYSPENRA